MANDKNDLWAALNESKPSSAPQPTEPKKKNPLVLGGIGLAVVAVLGVGGVVLLGGDDDPKDKGNNSSQSNSEDENSEWWDGKQNTPTEMSPWQKEEVDTDKSKITKEQETFAENLFEGQEYAGTVANFLVSKEAGFTSDPDEMIKDGFFNPMYTVTTQEDFRAESAIIVESILNPSFGGWAFYQLPEYNAKKEFNLGGLQKFFTQDYLNKVSKSKDRSFLPFYADWNSDDYGKLNLPESNYGRWFGRVVSADARMESDKNNRTVYKTEYKVEFAAVNMNKEVIKRKGTLSVDFVANSRRTEEGGDKEEYTIAVADAKLTVSEK